MRQKGREDEGDVEEERLLDIEAHKTGEALVAREKAEADEQDEPSERQRLEEVDKWQEIVREGTNRRHVGIDIGTIDKAVERRQSVHQCSDSAIDDGRRLLRCEYRCAPRRWAQPLCIHRRREG